MTHGKQLNYVVIGTRIPALVINRCCLLLHDAGHNFTSRPVAATDNSAREGEGVIILQRPRKRGRGALPGLGSTV